MQLYFAALKEQEVEKERDENDSQDSHFDSGWCADTRIGRTSVYSGFSRTLPSTHYAQCKTDFDSFTP